jgi:hypothetical protein
MYRRYWCDWYGTHICVTKKIEILSQLTQAYQHTYCAYSVKCAGTDLPVPLLITIFRLGPQESSL